MTAVSRCFSLRGGLLFISTVLQWSASLILQQDPLSSNVTGFPVFTSLRVFPIVGFHSLGLQQVYSGQSSSAKWEIRMVCAPNASSFCFHDIYWRVWSFFFKYFNSIYFCIYYFPVMMIMISNDRFHVILVQLLCNNVHLLHRLHCKHTTCCNNAPVLMPAQNIWIWKQSWEIN